MIIKNYKDYFDSINEGLIKTLDGDKPVIEIYEYKNSPVIKITLENGDIIKCTPQHKFLVKEEWSCDENNKCWKTAEELNENDIILSVKNI